jgi:8-hydroxy-5-deazaflavin:NADPH oxidoreductase
MKISVLGTGDVGQTLAVKLVDTGHQVMIGTRDVIATLSRHSEKNGNPPFSKWIESVTNIELGTFQESATFGEIVINATNGANSLNALDLAGEENLAGKILIDVSNPLDFSKGMPPFLLDGLHNTNSLGEEIQKEFPEAKVVKTFNTMWCGLMVNPGLIGGGDHINYISGNDNEAKSTVKKLLNEIGWKDENLIDLGDISAARATESVLLIWIRLMVTLNSGVFNFKIVK